MASHLKPYKIVTDQPFDQWPSTGCLTNCHSDVTRTHQHLAQNFNRPAPIVLTIYCNLCILKSGMLGSHRLVVITEIQHIATKLHYGCLCTVHWTAVFLPRCMECRRGIAMGILSVRRSVYPSVCQTCGLWQNGRKLYLDFYIIRKNIYPSFLRRRMVGWGRPLLPEILGQPAHVGAKSPILNQ